MLESSNIVDLPPAVAGSLLGCCGGCGSGAAIGTCSKCCGEASGMLRHEVASSGKEFAILGGFGIFSGSISAGGAQDLFEWWLEFVEAWGRRWRCLSGMTGCQEWIGKVGLFLDRNGRRVFVVDGVVYWVFGVELGIGSGRWWSGEWIGEV